MLIRTLVAALLILATIALIEVAPLPLFVSVVSAMLLLCVHELSDLLRAYPGRIYPPTYALTALLPWVWAYRPGWFADALIASVLALSALSLPYARELREGFPSASANILAVFYLGLPFSLVVYFRELATTSELWVLLLAIWAGDIAALLAGRAWGKRKVTPRISPHKSLEGFAAGLAATLAMALGLGGWLLPQRTLLFWGLAGVVIGAFGILGDLFESVIKRGANIKDSSGLLPGHGGLLDRLDSTLFAVPAYYLLTRLVE